MKCTIIWNSLPLDEWNLRFSKVAHSNILQSYHYAQSVCSLNRQKARWGLILIDGQEAGLLQILETGILWNMFHTVALDRGPLWFDGYGGAMHFKLFFEEFNAQFPKRFGRRRRIIPEIEHGGAALGILKQLGLGDPIEGDSYETLWWDLTIDEAHSEEQARTNLKSNWRNKISKAERADLTIEWDDTGKFYPWLRKIYAADKNARGYAGASPQTLDNLAKFSTQENPMIIGIAHDKAGKKIATVLFLKHGRSATYQVGWSSEDGRKYCAHHFLLWKARTMLQEYGVQELDLGGVNDDTAAGIKTFKEGTGAKLVKFVGRYQ